MTLPRPSYRSNWRTRAAALAAALVLSVPSVARAELADPEEMAETPDGGQIPPRWALSTNLQFRTEPVGLLIANVVRFRRNHPYDPNDALRIGRYDHIGLEVNISPAFVEVGPQVELMAVRLFSLRASYCAIYNFGLLGYALDFGRDDSFGDEESDAREGEEEQGLAHRFMLTPTVQYKSHRIIFQNQMNLIVYNWQGLGGQGSYFHERIYDTLQARQDGIFANQTNVFYEAWDGPGEARLMFGPTFEWVHAYAADLNRMRIAGTVVWLPTDHTSWNYRPRFVVQSGTNLEDRNREGAIFVQGVIGADFPL